MKRSQAVRCELNRHPFESITKPEGPTVLIEKQSVCNERTENLCGPYSQTGLAAALCSMSLSVCQQTKSAEVTCSTKNKAEQALKIILGGSSRQLDGITVLDWAQHFGGRYAIVKAARRGHLAVVQWLYYNRFGGCPTDAMNVAERYGQLQVMEWLYANTSVGCPRDAMDQAVMKGRPHAVDGWGQHVKWLHGDFCECSNTKGINRAPL